MVTGAGERAFSAGRMSESSLLLASGRVVEELGLENAVFDRFARLRRPTIAAISGVALGGGAEFAPAPTYGRIGFPDIRLGTGRGSGGLSRLPRLIGAGGASSWPRWRPNRRGRGPRLGLVDEIASRRAAST